MQKVIISGNVGRDSEISTFGDRQRLTFTVACSEGRGDQKVTTWYDVEYHNVGLQQYIKKGRQVVVVGKLRVKAYVAKDGTQRIGINVYADSVELVGGGGQQYTPQTAEPQTQHQPNYAGYNGPANAAPAQQPEQDDSGLPF